MDAMTCKAVVISQCETAENCFCIAKRQSYIEPETAVFLLTLPQLCQNYMTPCVRTGKWSESAAGIDGSATRIESLPLFAIRLQVPVLSVAFRPGAMWSRLGPRRVPRPERLFPFHGGARRGAGYNPRFPVARFHGRCVKRIPAHPCR